MNDDERVLQQWSNYIEVYEANVTAARQTCQQTVNTGSAVEIQSAKSDLAKQEAYLQILKTQYAKMQEQYNSGQPIDTSFSIDSTNNSGWSGVYRLQGSNDLYIINAFPCAYGGTSAVAEHFTIQSECYYPWDNNKPVTEYFEVTPYSGNNGYTGWYVGAGKPGMGSIRLMRHRIVSGFFNDNYTIDSDVSQYSDVPGTVKIYRDTSTPTLTPGSNVTFLYTWFGGQGVRYNLPDETIDTSSPWDYYNDNILPNITPENAAFPNGYQPFDPDQPQDEPKNLPDIAGADEDMQDNSTLISPAMFITQYILSAAQLRSLGENLWTSWLTPNTDVWKNFWYNFSAQADTGTCDIGAVLNFITSLKVFPFNLASMTTDYLSATDGIYIGTGHTNFLPGDIVILNTVIGYLDAGTVDVNLQYPYSDFRDYYNCSVMIFLPFCGTVQVNPVEVIGRTLHAKYYIDFQSGACTAIVLTSNGEHEYILCSKSGQIGFSIPITATNAGQLAARFAGDAVQTAGTLSGLFFNVAGNIANSAEQMAKALTFNKTASEGNEKQVPTGMTATSALNVGKAGVDAGLNLAEQAIDRLSRSAVDMPMLSGGSGCESLFQPSHAFVQIRRGKYAKPDNYPHSVAHLNLSSNPISYYKGNYNGTPSTGSDTDKGFCVFTNVDTSGLDCREDERAEIVALLESGIYL